MARMRGMALKQMRKADLDEAVEQLEDELGRLEEERQDLFRFKSQDWRQQLLDLDDRIGCLKVEIEGLEDGTWRAPVPAYDPADEVAVKRGHENPIAWVRRTEREVREAKRLRRIKHG